MEEDEIEETLDELRSKVDSLKQEVDFMKERFGIEDLIDHE